MPSATGWDLCRPADHQEFHRLCMAIVEAMYRPDVPVQPYGRTGQVQHGVDFYKRIAGANYAYQCKRVEKLTEADVREELAKFEAFPHPARSYTILTTLKTDKHLQDAVEVINNERVSAGRCPVTIVFWETIQSWLAQHTEVLTAFYPQLRPDLPAMLGGLAQRVEDELPGVRLQVDVGTDGIHYTVLPGDSAVDLASLRFLTAPALARLRAAYESNEPATFDHTEVAVRLAAPLASLMPGAAERGRLTVAPRPRRMTCRGRVVTAPRSKYPSEDMFRRRAGRIASGFPVEITTERATPSALPVVTARGVSAAFSIVCDFESVDPATRRGSGSVNFHRTYQGRSVQEVHAAEQLFEEVEKGVYVGVLDDDGAMTLTVETELYPPDEAYWYPDAVNVLVELAELSGWDIRMTEAIEPEDMDIATSLISLFRDGRRVFAGGTFRMRLRSQVDLAALQQKIREKTEPIWIEISHESEVRVLGQTFTLPRARICLALDEDAQVQLLEAVAVPAQLVVTVPPTTDVVEQLVPAGS